MANNVAETKVRISLTDNMSPKLRNIQGGLNNTNSAASSLSRSFKSLAASSAGIAAGALGIYSITDKVGEVIGKGLSFNKTMETNAVGMAGILSSMTRINGQQLQWNQAMTISNGLIKDMNNEALRTAATSQELIETFRAILGPGLGAGMNIEQIKTFTVTGVNAVKSLGLEGRQLVQELRDLVQGGIQPASSTLATALGLKDSDIKAAKASAQGLYAFLMERMRGFEAAAVATPKTLAGLEAQISEGMTRTLAVGFEPIMNEYKEVLVDIKGMLINTDPLGLNNDVSANLKEASQHVVNMWEGFKEIGSIVGTVVNPGISLLGSGLAFAMDNVKLIGAGFAAWQVGNAVGVLTQATTAQTALGSAVEKTTALWNSQKIAGQQAAQAEMQAALNATNVIQQGERQRIALLKERQSMEQAFSKLTKSGYEALAVRIQRLAGHYEKMGATAEQAGKMQMQVLKLAARGQQELAGKLISSQEQHLLAARAAEQHASRLQTLQNRALTLGTGLSALGMATTILADDTNSWIYEMGNAALTAGVLIDATVSLTTAIKNLKITAAGGILGAAAATVAAVGYGAYEKYQHFQRGGEFEYDETGNITAKKDPKSYVDNSAQIAYRRRQADKQATEVRKAAELASQLEAAWDAGQPKSGTKDSQKSRDKKKFRYEESVRDMEDLSAVIDRKIMELTGSYVEIENAKLDEELTKMRSKIDEAIKNGADTTGMTEKLAKLEAERKEEINRNSLTKQHEQQMSYYQAMQDAGLMNAYRADELRVQELESYKAHLQAMLTADTLTTEQRLQLQQQYSEAVIALQQAQATSWQDSWSTALEHLKNTQFDQLETLKSGWDDITGTISNFGQNMLTDQKSFSERCKDLYNDLANSIMNTMMKVIMQGLVMKSIMGIFGIGGGNISTNVTAPSINLGTDIGINGGMFRATGGPVTAGNTYMVGERGMELFTPAVNGYISNNTNTNRQFGGDSARDMKIIIENRSGQDVKAENARVSFNPKEMVINIVLEAVANNDNGMRDLLQNMVKA